jgi:subtilase family serine protease
MLAAVALAQGPRTVTIRGHIHPLAQRRFDRGSVAGLFQVNRVTIMFKTTAQQQADLNSLLEEQQDPSSPLYHKWLTPEEFGERFGLNRSEFDNAVEWLQDRGFTIDERAPGRNWIAFTGTARQLAESFNVRIHEYAVNGETHYATATEPSVPAAFGNAVLGFRGLHNFRARPRMLKSRFTSNITGYHYIVPDDFATIYDLHAIYNSGITGAGQKIVVVGQSDIQLQDIRAFRNAAGLPANDPQVIVAAGSRDPGIVTGDVDESSLDLEWAGAVARNAGIVFVTSTDVINMSLPYAVGQNIAPVITISYGDCEANWLPTERDSLIALTQQANAQGITIVAASGDGGAADCDSDFPGRLTARLGLSVDLPGAVPYVTAVGGTTLNEVGNVWTPGHTFGTFFGKGPAVYWTTGNNSSGGSALSYIPEVAWNDSLGVGELSSTGGGHSIYFSKPAWQAGSGVPNDNARDVPDISFSASAENDGYLTCSLGSCVNGFRASDNTLSVVGGTSVGAPTFGGIVVLINQMTNSRQGNVNPTLYRIANTSIGAFHDIVQGGNQVPCRAGTPDCPASGFLGYTAGPGYDLATGLGSIDVVKLLGLWSQSQP